MTWIRPAEAAKLVHMHPDTLARKVDAGEIVIRTMRSDGGHRKYMRSDVERAAAGNSGWAHDLIEEMAPRLRDTLTLLGLEVPYAVINDMYQGEWALLGDMKECESATDIDEKVCRIMSRELTGRDTPTYGDGSVVSNTFYQKLEAEALRRGWAVDDPVDQERDWEAEGEAAARAYSDSRHWLQPMADDHPVAVMQRELFGFGMDNTPASEPHRSVREKLVDKVLGREPVIHVRTRPERSTRLLDEVSPPQTVECPPGMMSGFSRSWQPDVWESMDPARHCRLVSVDEGCVHERLKDFKMADEVDDLNALVVTDREKYVLVCWHRGNFLYTSGTVPRNVIVKSQFDHLFGNAKLTINS